MNLKEWRSNWGWIWLNYNQDEPKPYEIVHQQTYTGGTETTRRYYSSRNSAMNQIRKLLKNFS